MPFPKCNKRQQGFTLIELLVVILIVSLVYFLGFSGVEIRKEKPKALTPLNLKENLLNNPNFTGQASLLCINKCKTCLMRPDIKSPYTAYDGKLDLGDLKVYTLDSSDILTEVEYERYDDQKICLKMDFFPNGSSTQLILKNEEASYFLAAHFDGVKVFDSPEDARSYWLEQSQLLSDQGNFY